MEVGTSLTVLFKLSCFTMCMEGWMHKVHLLFPVFALQWGPKTDHAGETWRFQLSPSHKVDFLEKRGCSGLLCYCNTVVFRPVCSHFIRSAQNMSTYCNTTALCLLFQTENSIWRLKPEQSTWTYLWLRNLKQHPTEVWRLSDWVIQNSCSHTHTKTQGHRKM